MYTAFLVCHSLLRWVVIVFGVLAVVRAVTGWRGGRPWAPADARAGAWFVGALDAQLLLGVVLYAFLSPMTEMAFGDMAAAMKTPALRYWAVEHAGMMVLAIVLAHAGRVLSKRDVPSVSRHGRAAVAYVLALLAVLAGTPWPFMTVGRPLIPGL